MYVRATLVHATLDIEQASIFPSPEELHLDYEMRAAQNGTTYDPFTTDVAEVRVSYRVPETTKFEVEILAIRPTDHVLRYVLVPEGVAIADISPDAPQFLDKWDAIAYGQHTDRVAVFKKTPTETAFDRFLTEKEVAFPA